MGFYCYSFFPSFRAIQRDNWKICDMLINSLCAINARTTAGCSALHYAVAYRRYDIVQLLLQNRIPVHQPTLHGVTAMSLAIENHLPLMVQLLMQYGYDARPRSEWGETPLEQAIKLHSEPCAMTLVLWGCGLQRAGQSYFSMAVGEGLLNLAMLLVALNPSVLNEAWVGGEAKCTPLALYRRPEFCAWLEWRRANCTGLAHLCRGKIWRYLGQGAPSKAPQLGLPAPVVAFLNFSEFFPQWFFDRIPLDNRDCPFTCPAFCTLKNCPRLEIKPSADDGEMILGRSALQSGPDS